MTPEQTALLTRCLELQSELEANEPPTWRLRDYDCWRQQIIYGPAYAISRWFGPVRERDRVRYRRALDVLEDLGLVELHREWDVRLTNVNLTEDGERVARELSATEAGVDA